MPSLTQQSVSRFALSLFRRLPGHVRGLSSREPSTNDLPRRFAELVKRFSECPPCSSSPAVPETGARPPWPHPFEYASLIEAYGRAGQAEEALRLLREMNSFSRRPDVVCYTSVIDILACSGRPEEALGVFEEMLSHGVAPDAAAFTVLVKLYSCCWRQFDVAYEVIRWMVKCSCAPDVVTYSTLIAGLCWAGRVEEALGILDQMLEEECLPNVYTFTPIVQAYCYSGRIDKAKGLMDTMEIIGCPPNTVTYNVLVEALCKIGAFDEVGTLLKDATLKGWQPDTITYSVYMDSLCKLGLADKSFDLFEVMLERGLRPNAVTLNILLDCLCRASRAWEAKCLLERSADVKWIASVVNYNTVMSRLSDGGRWPAVLKLFVDMFKKGIAANSWTFSIVVHCLSKAGMVSLAKLVFDSNGFVPNVMSYTTLIHYSYIAGKKHDVHHLFQKMAMDNIAPNWITYSVMITCLCRDKMYLEAVGCFYRSLKDGYSSKLVAHLLYQLVRGGKLKEVACLLDWILKQGFTIDVCIFQSLIKAFCRDGYCRSLQIYEICRMLDKMLQIG